MKSKVFSLAVNKANIVKFARKSGPSFVAGNLALKLKTNYEQPKVLIFKPRKSKKSNKIFCGCWQVANQEDAC